MVPEGQAVEVSTKEPEEGGLPVAVPVNDPVGEECTLRVLSLEAGPEKVAEMVGNAVDDLKPE